MPKQDSNSDKRIVIIAVVMALLAAAALTFWFWILYYDVRDHPPVPAAKALLVAGIPNLLAVLAVFVIVDRLRQYGLDQTQARLDRIYTYLNSHVKTLSAQVEVVDRMEDVPFGSLFATGGPVGIVSNFATLAFLQGKTALRSKFLTVRRGHAIVLADPEVASLVNDVAKSREKLTFANTPATVERNIRDSLAHLIEAIPDSVMQDSSRAIPDIEVLLVRKMVGYTTYWTDEAVFMCGLQTTEDADSSIPRLLMFGDSSSVMRGYNQDTLRRLRANARRPSLDEMLQLCLAVRNQEWVDKTKARLLAP